MNEGLRVLMVSAYYKNDQPGGLGVTLKFPVDVPEGMSGVAFCRGLEACLPEYDKLTVGEVLEGLRALGEARLDRREAAAEAIMGVHWLQVRRHLAVDEYNGTLFNCIFQNTLINSETNPVTVDLAAAMKSGDPIDVTDVVTASKHPGLDPGLAPSIRAVVDHARAARRDK